MAAKKQSKPAAPKKPNAQAFLREFAARQNELLLAVAEQVKRGEIAIDDSEDAESLLEHVTDEWCQTAEPNRALHMRMSAVIFYWALLDEVYGPEDDEELEPAPTGLNDVLVEALKTARSIWGKNG